MFWRSVVGKLAMTILLLVSFVLFILTILLLEFFENFHIQEAEKNMIQTATKISSFIRQGEEDEDVFETTERVKDPATQVVDRKSTRLNSSHVAISYAVFCLKNKT